MSVETIERLRKAAGEMRAEGQNGWPNVCDGAADVMERQYQLIRDMFVVVLNRCDQKDPKVKDVLIRAIKEQPDEAALSQ